MAEALPHLGGAGLSLLGRVAPPAPSTGWPNHYHATPLKLLRFLMLFSVATLLGCGPRDAGQSLQTKGPIFREVTVADGRPIQLGEMVSVDVQRMLTPAGANRFAMRPGTFGGADSIFVVLNSTGEVRALEFTYGAGTDFEAMIREYIEAFGPPARRRNGAASGEEIARWEDDRTTFEISQSGNEVRSVLSQRGTS